jgi:hypothetical protein
MPLDGSTATTPTPNHPAIAAANCPVPAPRSSTGPPAPVGSQGAIAARQLSIPTAGSARPSR